MERLGHRRPLLIHTGHHDGLLLLVKTIQLLSQTCDRFLGAEYKSRPADILGVTLKWSIMIQYIPYRAGF